MTSDPTFFGRATWPDRPLLMGIVNVTPDSFSDGGRFFRWENAVAHGLDLIRQGADILDVGGESTRPGSDPVAEDEELRRVLPVIRALAGEIDVPISVDPRKAAVADAALDAGARWVNDVGGLRDATLGEVVARHDAGIVLMHMKGEPKTMQQDPTYDDVVANVRRELTLAADRAQDAGIAEVNIWIDPGIGFGKTIEHNLELLANLDRLAELGYPVVVGASRKRFIGLLTGDTGEDRLAGSLAAAGAAAELPRSVVRVHDVAATRQYLLTRRSIEAGRPLQWPVPSSATSDRRGLEA
jgi:dihydropteroate synthase